MNEPILNDLIKILSKQGLIFFEGIKIPNIIRIPWTYNKNTFNWKLNSPEFKWRFNS